MVYGIWYMVYCRVRWYMGMWGYGTWCIVCGIWVYSDMVVYGYVGVWWYKVHGIWYVVFDT